MRTFQHCSGNENQKEHPFKYKNFLQIVLIVVSNKYTFGGEPKNYECV